MKILSYFNPFDKLHYQARKNFNNLGNKHKALTVVATALGALVGLPFLGVGGAMTGAATFRRMVEVNQNSQKGGKDNLPVYHTGLDAINLSRKSLSLPSIGPLSTEAKTSLLKNHQFSLNTHMPVDPHASSTLADYNENNSFVKADFKNF